MSVNVHFIEVEPEDGCRYCGRRKLSETDKFYRVFLGVADNGIVVCELCKGGFSTRFIEGIDKTHSTHLAYYVRHSFLALREKLPTEIADELNSALESYENGDFSSSFRNIGVVSEWLTQRLFISKFGGDMAQKSLRWEDMLGRLLHLSRKNKNTPEEAIVFQLFSLKWLRNSVDHPSEYKITGEDVRLGLISIAYLLNQAKFYRII